MTPRGQRRKVASLIFVRIYIAQKLLLSGKCSPPWAHDFIMLDLHRFDLQIKNLFFLRNINSHKN